MNILSDLVYYIEGRKVEVINRGDNLAMQLYWGIKKGKFGSDEEACSSLYGENAHRSIYYNSTKRKLKNLLYNTFLASMPKREDYWERLHQVEKKTLVANQLALRGKVSSAIRIMEEVLGESLKLHFIQAAQLAAYKLANWYASTGDHRKYKKRFRLEKELVEQLHMEQLAERSFFDLYDSLRHQKGIDTKVIQKAEAFHDRLRRVKQDTFNFRMFSNYITIIYYELNNQGDRVVEACREALGFFRKLPFELPNRTFRFFTIRMIPALLQQGDYQEAIEKLNEAEAYVQRGSLNWASMQEYKAIAGFHLQDLSIVADSIALVRSNRSIFTQKREEIRVLEGYLAFLKKEAPSRFKVGKFLNEMPQYSADKKGMNINILIIQILILLRRRKLPPIIDRMEALRTYTYRHLKGDPATRRPDLFIRLLLLVSRHSFDSKIVLEKAAPLLAQLEQEPRHLQSIDIEIVPYEVLWDRITEVLEAFYW